MVIVQLRYERRVNTHDYDNTVYAAECSLAPDEDTAQAMHDLAVAVVAWAAMDLRSRFPRAAQFDEAVGDADIRRAAGRTEP